MYAVLTPRLEEKLMIELSADRGAILHKSSDYELFQVLEKNPLKIGTSSGNHKQNLIAKVGFSAAVAMECDPYIALVHGVHTEEFPLLVRHALERIRNDCYHKPVLHLCTPENPEVLRKYLSILKAQFPDHKVEYHSKINFSPGNPQTVIVGRQVRSFGDGSRPIFH